MSKDVSGLLFNKVFVITTQIVLIFIFLTVFFFTYVNVIEKQAFQTQMNLVVDSIFQDDINISDYAPNGDKDLATVIIDGSLELAKKNAIKNLQSDDDDINKQNKQIENNAFMIVGIVSGSFIVFAIVMYFLKKTISFKIHFTEAIIGLIFIGLTELFFLNIITKKYYSVDTNQIKYRIGGSMQNYVKNRKNI